MSDYQSFPLSVYVSCANCGRVLPVKSSPSGSSLELKAKPCECAKQEGFDAAMDQGSANEMLATLEYTLMLADTSLAKTTLSQSMRDRIARVIKKAKGE